MNTPSSPPDRSAASRYLVIANRTTDSDTLRAALLERTTRGPAEFVVMVPVPQLVNAALATLATDPVGGIIYSLPLSEAEEAEELDYAQQRLDALVQFLVAHGGAASRLGPSSLAKPRSTSLLRATSEMARRTLSIAIPQRTAG